MGVVFVCIKYKMVSIYLDKNRESNHKQIYSFNNLFYLLNKYLREHEEYNKIKKFWQDHTKAIRLFHRYPHRNEILGRESTEEEKEFLKGPNSSW